jgi:hypothetical protein
MRDAVLLALLVTAAAGCAKNRESEESGAAGAGAARVHDTTRMHDSTRIHDTTMTAKDTLTPADTMPHIRDSMPDSTRK